MASRPISIDTSLAASGGDDTVTETATVSSDDAAFQFEISGSTTDLDVHVEARLGDGFAWQDYVKRGDGGWVGQANGDGIAPYIIDLGAVDQVRVRIVNQDGSNGANVLADLMTE